MSNFTKRLSTIAMNEYSKYRFLRENQEPLKSHIELYWAATDAAFTNVGVPWSAVFVSWCVRTAGAGANDFAVNSQHSQYVYAAINQLPNSVGFVGRDVASYAPKVGDILQNNRSGQAFDFARASTKKSYISHAAMVIEVGQDNAGAYLRTIGGNESDAVGMKEVRLNPAGKVRNADGLYISVLECLL